MTSKNSTIVSSIYKARSILLEQLQKRGFDISNYSNFSIHEIHTMFSNEQLDMLLSNDKDHKVYVKFHLEKSLRKENIMNAVDELFNIEMILNKETDSLIIITKDEQNDTLIKSVNHIWNSEKAFVILYNIKRLQFNILDHVLVPNHIILDENEEKTLCEKYNIENKFLQLPEISRFDPVAIAIGIRPGQICKIERYSKTAIKTDYYRICKE